MKRTIFLIGLFICVFLSVKAQISTNEEPISFREENFVRSPYRETKAMPALKMDIIEQEDAEDEANGVPPRFGYSHKVSLNLQNSGVWQVLSNGDKLWQLTIHCPKALSINLLYDKFWLPKGGKFFIYTTDRKHSIGAFTSVNNKGDKNNLQGFATGLLYGDEITLEYYQPRQISEQAIISVAYVVQGYRYIQLPSETKNLGSSGSCQVNINCPEGLGWQREKNAVALILVNGNRYCTGSLINTTANDNNPLFLTADHCLGGWGNNYVKYDAINNPNLSHWSFYWHYEVPGCNNTSSEPPILSTSGATVVANNSVSDFALLRLTENPCNKQGVTPYYLGWDRSGNSGASGVGIHHPSGDVKKISTYNTPMSTYYLNNSPNDSASHWRVTWRATETHHGVTEGGSSGSPLLNNNHRIIGQLHGGYASCNSLNSPDWYGKFSVSWTGNGATDKRRKLQPWLDPRNTGAIVLDGKGTIPDTPADLLIRDYMGDDGEEPGYNPNDFLCGFPPHSPDIKLLDIDTQQPIGSLSWYNKKNCYISVNIKNIGGKTTEGRGKERLHLFSSNYLITTLPSLSLPLYQRLTPTKGLPIGKLAYNEQKVAAGLFNWELPEKKLKAIDDIFKKSLPSVDKPNWGFDILAVADEKGNSIIQSTADTVLLARGAEDIARHYNSAAIGYWQRRTLWSDMFNQIIRILPPANKPFSLSLNQPTDKIKESINDFAEVNILLCNNLMANLITAGNPKIKVIDRNRVRLLSSGAKLEFRPIKNNNGDYFAGVEVKFFSDRLPQINSFDFGLNYSEQGKKSEMVHFTAVRDSSIYFKAQAEANKQQVFGNEEVTLTASNIGEEAKYIWYDRSGNIIGKGANITTVPTSTDTYTLEVERADNGYKSYSEVEVVALAGRIVSLSPNPAHNELKVVYQLSANAKSAALHVSNLQNTLSISCQLDTNATEKQIVLSGFSSGTYIVKLLINGTVVDSQNLIVY